MNCGSIRPIPGGYDWLPFAERDLTEVKAVVIAWEYYETRNIERLDVEGKRGAKVYESS